MEGSEILEILNDWNFWKKGLDAGIMREDAVRKIGELAKAREIVVIKGVRRCGKSTSLLQFCKGLIEDGAKKKNILIVNLEDPRFKGLSLDLLNKVYEVYQTELLPDKSHVVVLDEVQNVDGWEKFARFLHENRKVGVFVTGSSSKLLSSEYSTVLAGRHLDFDMCPLSFKEYIFFKGIVIKDKLDILEKRHVLKSEFKSYLMEGGFPKAVIVDKPQKKELLEIYFGDIIVKDIVKRYKVKEVNKIEELAKYYLTNVSTLQSFNNIKNVLKMNLDTIERFSFYLSSVFLIDFVKKFSYSEKEQLINPRKAYCVDNGMRNSVAFVFSKDYGRLAENIVFNALKKKGEIFYWKSQKQEEVDFVVKIKQKPSMAVQVCWEVEDREVKNIVAACMELKLKEGLILTEDTEKEIKVNGIKLSFKPVWKWLLE